MFVFLKIEWDKFCVSLLKQEKNIGYFRRNITGDEKGIICKNIDQSKSY